MIRMILGRAEGMLLDFEAQNVIMTSEGRDSGQRELLSRAILYVVHPMVSGLVSGPSQGVSKGAIAHRI